MNHFGTFACLICLIIIHSIIIHSDRKCQKKIPFDFDPVRNSVESWKTAVGQLAVANVRNEIRERYGNRRLNYCFLNDRISC